MDVLYYLMGFTLPWKSRLTSVDEPPLLALPRQMPLSSFLSEVTLVKPAASMRDFACPSVKLFAPAAGVVAVRVPSSTRAAALLSVVRLTAEARLWHPAKRFDTSPSVVAAS